jgi:bifunctional polynucleotide phosphatase/kinase
MTLIWNSKNESNSTYLFAEPLKFILKPLIACFDIDSTIIKTKSGKKFPQNKDDWVFFNKNVIEKIKKLKKTHSIIFVTNQSGLKTDDKINDWQIKISNVCNALKCDIRVYCSIDKDIFRKPQPTFINILKKELQNKSLNDKSFYCGDAAGRPGDFNDTDYKFALNSNLIFYVPEQLFNEEIYDDINVCAAYVSTSKKNNINKPFIPINNGNEMILMVGFPGSGKSKYVTENIIQHGYVRINQDTLKTKQKCLKETINHINKNNNIVIDNLNDNDKTRKEYIDIAKKYNYRVRCLIMTTSKLLSIHNMLYRTYVSDGQINRIPDVVYHVIAKRYKRPQRSENIDVIEKIHFVKPNDDVYNMYFS